MSQSTRNHLVFFLQGAWWSIVAMVLRTIRMSFLIGSRGLWLSGSQLVMPLSGLYGGTWACLISYLIRVALITIEHPHWGLLSSLVYHMPSFFASLYASHCLSEKNNLGKFVLGVLLPCLAMVLFITNAIGQKAWWYSLYWLIPVIGTVLMWRSSSRFGVFLSATFIAHAVGSICWLWTHQLTALEWQGLVFCVWYERLAYTFIPLAIAEVYDRVSACALRMADYCRRRWMLA